MYLDLLTTFYNSTNGLTMDKKLNQLCKMLCLCIALISNIAQAAPPEDVNRFFSLVFENDVFTGADEGYTNGVGLLTGRAGFDDFDSEHVPAWISWLIKDTYINSGGNDKTRAIAHMFFQRMQTPENIITSAFIPNDLPYAGFLSWQGTAYSWDAEVSDQLSLFLGFVGPVTLAAESQKIIHEIIDADDPRGWRHQLKNEPVFKIELHRALTLFRQDDRRRQFDVIGLGGFGVGTIESAAHAGFAVRWGTNLAQSLGAFTIRPSRHVNPLAFTESNDFYLFAGARASFVANDILVNGNTFTDSPSVPLENLQNEFAAGGVWSRNRWAFVFALSSASSRTELFNDRGNRGSFSVTYRY